MSGAIPHNTPNYLTYVSMFASRIAANIGGKWKQLTQLSENN